MGWGATCGNISTNGRWSHEENPETPIKHSSENSPGQYDSGLIHQQPGRNPLSKVNVSDSRAVELVSTTQYISEGGISSGCPERPSGQRIEGVHRLERLENTIGGYRAFSQGEGNRPVCHQIDESTATLYATDAFTVDWSTMRGYAFPPFNLIPRTLMKVRDDNATLLLVAPICQAQHWWPLLLQLAISLPVRLPLSQTLLENPSNLAATHPMYPRLRLAVWVISNNAAQQKAFRVQLPDCCLPPHDSRQTKPMTPHGESGVAGVIQGMQIDTISANIRDILVFLSDQFDNKLQYRTINVLRSAISSVHPWIDGKPVGQHPLVIRLMKGIANERPSKPRYSSTWDVSRVTSYLSSLGDNDKLCLKLLTKKLLMLLALVSPERSSVLSDLDIQFLKKQPDGFTFTLTKPRKTGDTRSLTTIAFPCFKEDSTLCPLKCLESYLNATSEFRTLPECKKLFLSTLRPHRPVSKSTIARWLCDTITASGIDSTIFKAHSTRAASTSTAAQKQLPLNDILKMGDWTSSSTFQRFYYKPTIDDSYAKTILKS